MVGNGKHGWWGIRSTMLGRLQWRLGVGNDDGCWLFPSDSLRSHIGDGLASGGRHDSLETGGDRVQHTRSLGFVGGRLRGSGLVVDHT